MAQIQSNTRGAGRAVLDLGNYTPALLAIITNRLSRGASARYFEEFGVGIVEWRVLSTLAIETDIPASRVTEVTGTDKSAVSRALTKLSAGKLAVFEASKSDPRRKSWRLTAKGTALHDRMIVVALEREKTLLTGLTGAEVKTFIKIARKMVENSRKLI